MPTPIMNTRGSATERQYADADIKTPPTSGVEYRHAAKLEQNTKLGRYEGTEYPTGQGAKK